MSFGVRTFGLKSLLGRYGRASAKGIIDALRAELETIGERLIGEAQKRIIGKRATNPPDLLGVKTGRLRQNISKRLFKSGRGLGLVVGTKVVYAAIHEFGGQAGRGGVVYIRPRPYLGPALKVVRPEIARRLGRAVKAEVTRA